MKTIIAVASGVRSSRVGYQRYLYRLLVGWYSYFSEGETMMNKQVVTKQVAVLTQLICRMNETDERLDIYQVWDGIKYLTNRLNDRAINR